MTANNTGDGLLMAAGTGVALSGMEFTGYYTVAPAHTTMTRSMSYAFATYADAAGRELPVRSGAAGVSDLAAALIRGKVFCNLGRMPADLREALPRISPNVTLVFDRLGIDPFTDWFEVTLYGEGTVRGTGGVCIADEACQTTTPGLFVVGDVATREPIAGAISGGGAQNSAWALSTGLWAGRGAAALAARHGNRAGRRAQPVGTTPFATQGSKPAREIVQFVRDQMLDYDRNLFRSQTKLQPSRAALDALWDDVRTFGVGGSAADPARAREAATLIAAGRWSWAAALARTESRGLHQRVDAPATDAAQARRLLVGGLDEVWTRFDAPVPAQAAAQ